MKAKELIDAVVRIADALDRLVLLAEDLANAIDLPETGPRHED